MEEEKKEEERNVYTMLDGKPDNIIKLENIDKVVCILRNHKQVDDLQNRNMNYEEAISDFEL